MKKLSISLLVMLLIASLFTSCSNGSDDASDVRVKVRLTPSSGSRSLSTVTETINLDDDSITWHYSATKVSEKQFNYGATSDSLLPKDGIVTLSQGEWSIGLWGIKDGKKVYAGTTSKVTIKWNFYEPNVTVQVPVNENTGDKGYIVLTDVKISVDGTLKTPNFATIDNNIIANLNGANSKIECAPGSHTITISYKEGEIIKASKSLVVTVVSGRETTISGNIDKNETFTGTEVKETEVKKDTKVEVITSVTPANTSSPGTKITFEAGSFTEDSSNAVLNLTVKSAGGEFNVTSLSGSSPVAGIDISLFVNGNKVTSFNGKEVVIETYIAKNLSNVKVYYDGSEITGSTYTYSTGKLVFKTTHFSEFYVLADCVALNVNKNIGYDDLDTAVDKAESGDLIKIYESSTERMQRLKINKSITLEGVINDGSRPIISMANGVNEVEDRGINIDENNIDVVIKNLAIDTRTNSYTPGGNYYPRGISVSGSNINLVIDNCDVKSKYYALNITPDSSGNTFTINNSTFHGWAAINAYGTGNTITVNRSRLVGINDKAYNAAGWNNFATICLEGDTTGHTTIGSSDYQVIINDSTIEAKQTTGNKQRAIGFNSNSMNCSVSLNNTTIVLGDEEKCSFANDTGIENKIIINGELIYEGPEANCWYSNGNFEENKESGGMYTNLLLPFNGKWMAAGEGIILEKDIVLTEDIACQMTSGSFYFYLDEHNLSGGSIIINEDVSVISDTGGLSIFKSAINGREIACTDNGNETYTYYVNSSV